MKADDLLVLARLLHSRLALIRPADSNSADELRDSREYCETLVEKLESILEEVETELAEAAGRPNTNDEIH